MHATLDALRLVCPRSYSSEGTPPVLLNGVEIRRARRSGSRLSFGYGRHIIKVGLQSRFEVEMWDRLHGDDRPYFAEPVAWGTVENDFERRWWIAQRVLPIKRAFQRYTVADWRAAWDFLIDVLDRNDIQDVGYEDDGRDACPHNWTIVNGRPIVFDYAC